MKKIIKKVKRKHAVELLTYALVGGSAWLMQTIIYFAAIKVHIFPSVSMILGNFGGFLVSYFGHVKFTFKRTHKFSRSEFIKFAVTSIIGLVFNVCGVRIVTKVLLWGPELGVLPTILTPGITFLISKFWAFK